MDWVHYLNDSPSTEWGRLRAANGHPEPYGVRYFQIDNEPMNNGFTPERYAEIVNVYGCRLRVIASQARIVECGQKRSNDMAWSHKVIDAAGKNFDVLGVHNYEYEPENFETGLRRIRDYLLRLRDYIRASAHPDIEIGVLKWSLARTYDWRAGLHTAGSLILYEELSPGLTMSCPTLLMRNTTDDPAWRAPIYHNHVSVSGICLRSRETLSPAIRGTAPRLHERRLPRHSRSRGLLQADLDHDPARLDARHGRRHR